MRAFAAATLLLALAAPARASIVLPNGFDSTAGPTRQLGILGNGVDTSYIFQVGYSASQLATVAPGTSIISLGFRLSAGQATFANALAYSQFRIQIGRAAEPIGSFSGTFAANEGADTITARSGALTIAGGSLVGGAGPNPFFDIAFTTPYVYTGGDLAITILSVPSGTPQFVPVDAVPVGGVTDTVATFDDPSATTGQAHFFNAPIVRLGFAAVPEPSSVVLCGIAALTGLGYARARRGPAVARAATLGSPA